MNHRLTMLCVLISVSAVVFGPMDLHAEEGTAQQEVQTTSDSGEESKGHGFFGLNHPFQQYPFNLYLFAVLLHAGTFVVLFFLLKAVLFDPLLSLIQERNEEIEGGKRQIDEQRERLSKRIQEFENRMEEERQKATEEMQNIVSEGEERRKEIVNEAHEKSLRILEDARAEVAEERKRIERDLQDQAADVARQMAERISGSDLGPEEIKSHLQDVS